MSSILKAGLPQKPLSSTPIKYAAAAAAAVAPQTSNSTQTVPQPQTPTTAVPPALTTHPITPVSAPPTIETSMVLSSPSLTHPSVTSPILSSSASLSQQPDDSFYSGQGSPALSETVPSSVSGPAVVSSPQRATVVRKGMHPNGCHLSYNATLGQNQPQLFPRPQCNHKQSQYVFTMI